MNKVKHVRTLSNNKGWIHWFETSTAYHLLKSPGIMYSGAFCFQHKFLFEWITEFRLSIVEIPGQHQNRWEEVFEVVFHRWNPPHSTSPLKR